MPFGHMEDALLRKALKDRGYDNPSVTFGDSSPYTEEPGVTRDTRVTGVTGENGTNDGRYYDNFRVCTSVVM